MYGDVAAVEAGLSQSYQSRLSEALVLACARHHTIPLSPGRLRVLELLLKRGADPNARGGWAFERPITAAASSGFAGAVELLLNRGAERDSFAMAAIGDVEGVERLIRASHDLARATDEAGLTMLHHCANSRLGNDDSAVASRLQRIATVLLEAGADVDAPCIPPPQQRIRPRVTPLVYACIADNREVAVVMLEYGADPNRRCDWGTPLMQASKYSPRIGALLVQRGAMIDASVSDDGRTALHVMSHFPHPNAVRWLLDHNADPAARTHDGRTPLHFAAMRNTGTKVVEMLLAAGADPAARDNAGRSALDFAEEHDRRKVITLLRGLSSSLARP